MTSVISNISSHRAIMCIIKSSTGTLIEYKEFLLCKFRANLTFLVVWLTPISFFVLREQKKLDISIRMCFPPPHEYSSLFFQLFGFFTLTSLGVSTALPKLIHPHLVLPLPCWTNFLFNFSSIDWKWKFWLSTEMILSSTTQAGYPSVEHRILSGLFNFFWNHPLPFLPSQYHHLQITYAPRWCYWYDMIVNR